MVEQQKMLLISKDDLVKKVSEMSSSGHRLVQISCTKIAAGIEINYSFDKNYEFTNLRITIASTDEAVPSVSKVYLSAVLYENEMHDLFGVKVEGMAIDYKGTFYRTSIKTPFNPGAKNE